VSCDGSQSRLLTKCSIFRSDTDDEHVERYFGGGSVALDLGIVIDVYHALFMIDLSSLGFVVLDRSFLVPQEVADRLHDAAVLDRADGTRRKEGRKEEVIARRDDDDIVVFGVQLLQERY